MYTVYTSTSFSLRLKTSFPYHRLLPPPDDGGGEDCYFAAAPLLPAISATPSLLCRCYFLRQSSLLHSSPARALLPSLCRGLRGRGGDSSLSLYSRVLRRRCCCSCSCGGENGASRVARDGGEISDVLGLLTGLEYERCGGSASICDRGSSRDSIASEEDLTESTSSSSTYRGRVTSDRYVSDANRTPHQGRDWKKENMCSFSGNLSADVEALYGKKGRRSRASSLSNSSSHHKRRAEHVQEGGNRCSREEREQQLVSRKEEEKVSRVSRVREESRKEKEASGFNVEASSVTASLLEEIKRQHVEIEQLRKSCKELIERRLDEQESELARASVSEKASSRVEEREEISASVGTLIEELKKQRTEIDQLQRSYQEIVTSSEVHVHDSERISKLNNVFVSRQRDRDENLTTVVNLIDKERDHVNFEEEMKRERCQDIEKSTVIQESYTQNVSSLDRISLSRMKQTGECSSSAEIEKKREQFSYADQYKKAYDELMKSSEAAHRVDRGRTASTTELSVSKEDTKESSSTGTSAIEERRQQKNHSKQLRETNLKREILTRTQKLDSGSASNQNEVPLSWSDRKENSTSAMSVIEEIEEQRNYAAQLKVNDQNIKKSSEVHKIDFSRESSSKNLSVLLPKGKEASSTSDKYLADERIEQQSHTDQIRKDTSKLTRAAEKYDADKKKLTKASEIHDTNNWRLTRASEIHDTNSRRLTRALEIHDTDSRKLTRASEIHAMDTIGVSDSIKTISSKSAKEVGSTSTVNLVEGSTRPKSYLYEPENDNVNLMKSPGMHVHIDMESTLERLSDSVSGDLEESVTSSVEGHDQEVHTDQLGRAGTGSSYLKLTEISAIQESLIDSHKLSGLRVKEEEESSLKLVQEEKTKEKANILRESQSSGKISSTAFFDRILETGSGSVKISTEGQEEQATRDDLNRVRDDILESVSRLNESSSQYVSEFVDKVREEISVLTEIDVVAESPSPDEIENAKNETDKTSSSSQESVSDNAEKNKSEMYLEGPRPSQSSAFSEGRRGPSDEMWDVTGPSIETRAQNDEAEPEMAVQSTSIPTSSERAIIRRSSRSLWGYIADIIRMGWISRAVSRRSSPKSGTKTSSNESASSETWFSGRDADEDDDNEHGKRRRGAHDTILIKRSIDEQTSASQVSGKGSEATTFENKLSPTPEEGSVLLGTGGDNKIFSGSSSIPGAAAWAEGGTMEHGSTSAVVAAVLPSATADIAPVPNVILRADIIEKVEKSKIDVTESEPHGQKLAEAGDIEIKDGDLRRRKLQRKKQALKEQFDEWEEAYKLESERRKTDELFMREALLEAKKAADSWEVPIGAVLVQNGKVIARGSNLVEELRDSTAHAEIICIREASNLLRTWRLSETTLYVTLEPCAMCAGAILQSRIDTVVWGAPNKLLGADGSWVRLFPGGNDGKDDLGQSSQPAGPIHPFHPKINVRRGILATECSEVMQHFFQLRRKDRKKEEQPQQSHMSISNLQNKFISKMHNMFCAMFCL